MFQWVVDFKVQVSRLMFCGACFLIGQNEHQATIETWHIYVSIYFGAHIAHAWKLMLGCFKVSDTFRTCTKITLRPCVATLLWGKCEDETRTPKSGNLESSGTPETSELDCKGQNTSPRSFFYIFGKVLKCRYRKWPRMSHSDICSTSYGQKKGWESNWQFDSRPLKVRNRPDPDVCKWNATHRWKDFEEIYKFALDLIPIRGLSWELWSSKVPGIQTETILGLPLGSLGTKSHSDVGAVGKRREYYMGEGGGFSRIWAVVS